MVAVKNCPRCGKDYADFPAMSRTDNKTEVCPPCGTAEALEDFLGSGAMSQAEWVKNREVEFQQDVREMRSVEIVEIISGCSHDSWAWLDCAECRDRGDTCDIKVCAECGDTVS